jgi:uncharacterized protein (TIGR02145 family)
MKKKNSLWIYPLLIIGLTIIFASGCKKSDEDSTVPVLTTTVVSSIASTTAVCGGTISSDGGADITARGVCWGTSQNPTTANSITTDGSGTGSFTSNLTGLTSGTTYYVRAYATNSAGTGYGNSLSFSTIITVTDLSGNVYHGVKIGTQVWMVENLQTTKLNDGTNIPEITVDADWTNLTSSGYCWYDNNSSTSYGALYNWYAVNTGKLAPSGWHVASDADWKTLEAHLGMSSLELDAFGDWRGSDDIIGAQLKEAGTTHWASPNSFTTNELGFTALPGGLRSFQNGNFNYYGTMAQFWTLTGYDATDAYIRELSNADTRILRSAANIKNGQSVRCVMD